MLPLGCFPLWGREGVTLPYVKENKGSLERRLTPEQVFLKNR
jgi:hypothetical protein